MECIMLDGRKKMVRKDGLVLRQAVYGIVAHDGKVLLMASRRSRGDDGYNRGVMMGVLLAYGFLL